MLRYGVLIGACLLVVLLSFDALARHVTQPVVLSENATRNEAVVEARSACFRQAVLDEALELLPGSLDLSRSALLEEFLGERAAGYVLSYQELGQDEGEPGLELTLDVQVNRPALKRDLQSLGVLYTTSVLLPFSLHLEDVPEGELPKVSLLQTLSGLRIEDGADPALELHHSKDGWSGRLRTDGTDFLSQNERLVDVWLDLWGRYFRRVGASLEHKDTVSLAVSGWYAPDGVQQFDALLRGWTEAVDAATLAGLRMGVEGIEADWVVKLNSRELLDRHLEQYLPPRQLRWTLGDSGDNATRGEY